MLSKFSGAQVPNGRISGTPPGQQNTQRIQEKTNTYIETTFLSQEVSVDQLGKDGLFSNQLSIWKKINLIPVLHHT